MDQCTSGKMPANAGATHTHTHHSRCPMHINCRQGKKKNRMPVYECYAVKRKNMWLAIPINDGLAARLCLQISLRRMYWVHFVFTLAAINRLIFVQLVRIVKFCMVFSSLSYVFDASWRQKKAFGSHHQPHHMEGVKSTSRAEPLISSDVVATASHSNQFCFIERRKIEREREQKCHKVCKKGRKNLVA